MPLIFGGMTKKFDGMTKKSEDTCMFIQIEKYMAMFVGKDWELELRASPICDYVGFHWRAWPLDCGMYESGSLCLSDDNWNDDCFKLLFIKMRVEDTPEVRAMIMNEARHIKDLADGREK